MSAHSVALGHEVLAHRTKLKVPAHANHRRNKSLMKLPPFFARFGALAQPAQNRFWGVALGAIAALNLWGGHGSGGLLGAHSRVGDHLFEAHRTTSEVANGLHVVERHTVCLPLRNCRRGYPEVRSKRGPSAFFSI